MLRMAYYNPPYTPDEQNAILNYLIEKDVIDKIKGDRVWKDMEAAGIVDRTWQSMKQHFKTTISFRLTSPQFNLEESVLKKFRQVLSRVDTTRKNTSRKKVAKPTGKYPKFTTKFSSSDSDNDTESGPSKQASSEHRKNTKPLPTPSNYRISSDSDDTPSDIEFIPTEKENEVIHIED